MANKLDHRFPVSGNQLEDSPTCQGESSPLCAVALRHMHAPFPMGQPYPNCVQPTQGTGTPTHLPINPN